MNKRGRKGWPWIGLAALIVAGIAFAGWISFNAGMEWSLFPPSLRLSG